MQDTDIGRRGADAPAEQHDVSGKDAREIERRHQDAGKLKPKETVSDEDRAHTDARQRDPAGEYETVEHAERQIEQEQKDKNRSPTLGGPDWVPQIDEVDQTPDER